MTGVLYVRRAGGTTQVVKCIKTFWLKVIEIKICISGLVGIKVTLTIEPTQFLKTTKLSV